MLKLFSEWRDQRNGRANTHPAENISPIYVPLDEMTKDEINYSVSRFLCEIRKVNKADYPGDTLHEMVICLQLYFEQIGKPYKLLQDPHFIQLRNTLDGLMQDRAKAGLGIRRRQAQIITQQEEDLMWEKGVLGTSDASRLLKTMVYMLGVNFALRAAQDHRNLRWSPNPQLQVLRDSENHQFLRFTEDVSKSNRGGLLHKKVKAKVVDAYANEANPSRCIVAMYNKYLHHCPDNKPEHAFYLRPLAKPNGEVWYAAQALGRHKLGDTVKSLCEEAGLGGYRTNHSLRATTATRLYEQNVDEQRICEVTGHRSTAVRDYKRTSESMKRKVSNIVQCRSEPLPEEVVPSEMISIKQSKLTTNQSNGDDKHISVTVNLNIN